jgi:hypothetical protein
MQVLHQFRTPITNQHKAAGRPNVAGILLNASLAGSCSFVAVAFWRAAGAAWQVKLV